MEQTKSFWNELGHPIFTLAPMEDVTDTVFREVVLSVADPKLLNVVFTEFCSTDGLCHAVGRSKVAHRLLVSESERMLLKQLGVKLVAQIWGSRPEKFGEAVRWISDNYSFDGIDINMGCPAKKIVKQGGCSALIASPNLAKEIIAATQESTSLPVSVKTRTGILSHQTESWITNLLEMSLSAITLHCRTQSDMSERPADYAQMKIATELRDAIAPGTVMIGNGDIFTIEQARHFVAQTGADGAMFGRGIFQNPWLFAKDSAMPTPIQRIDLLLKHARLYESTWGRGKNFSILRRFFKIYVNQLPNAGALRGKLMLAESLEEVEQIVGEIDFSSIEK